MSRILLVEDHEDSAELLTMLLEDEGFEVGWAATGAAAVALFDHGRPDVVLLDLTLPDVDGLELGKRLAAAPGAAPIVVMSAKAADVVADAADEVQAAAHVVKP